MAQSPLAPHHIFVSGYRDQDYWHARALIVELTSGGEFVGYVMDRESERGEQRGPGECPVTGDFIDAIDFLSDGRIAALATLRAPSNGVLYSGVFLIEPPTGSVKLLLSFGSEMRSLSVLRGTDEGDLVALVHFTCFVGASPPPPQDGIQLRRLHLDGTPTTEVGVWADTLGWPGEPGMARFDGMIPGSLVVTAEMYGQPVPDLIFPDGPVTFEAAALSSFLQPYNGHSFGDLVTFSDARVAMGAGGRPGYKPNLCVQPAGGAQQCSQTASAADAYGLVAETARLPVGFSQVWYRPDNHPIQALLTRDVYRLPDPPILSPP